MAAGTYCPGDFTVGRDFRDHSDELEKAFVSGVTSTGSNVQLVETCPASLCVFANWQLENNVAAYITASHLPANWNGIKFFHQDGVGFFEDENHKLEQIHLSGKFRKGQGQTEIVRMEEKYLQFTAERIKPEKLKVVADFGNGAASLLVPKILKEIGVEASYLFDKPDPKFSHRNPEPTPESLTALSKKVVAEGGDLGIGFDGDGDRAMFVDDTGKVLMTEQSAILFIREIMKTQKGPVVANIECSDIIEDEVSKYGEKVFRIPVGHTFLVQETKRHNAIFGVEKSGHICVPRFYWFDDAIINSIYMAEIVSKMDNKLSEIVKTLPMRFFDRTEIDCSDETKFSAVEKIKQKALEAYGNVNTIDGVKIAFSDSWALIRASNTSPMLRLSIEARDQERIRTLKNEMTALIESIDMGCQTPVV